MSKKVVITADSPIDIGGDLAARFDIHIIPMYVNLNDKSYKDGVDLYPDDIFKNYDENGTLPTTSAIPIGDYADFFSEFLNDGAQVVHFSLSSEISSTHNNAKLAAEELDGVYVIDSLHLSSSIALQAIKACEMRDSGMSAEEIARAASSFAEKTCTSFVLEKLEYMKKGGRCSATAALGANILGIRPCIEMHGGTLDVAKKYRGKISAVRQQYVADQLAAHKGELDLSRIFLTHSGMPRQEIDDLCKLIKKTAPFKEVLVARAGCTISSHCGPGCMGILFMVK